MKFLLITTLAASLVAGSAHNEGRIQDGHRRYGRDIVNRQGPSPGPGPCSGNQPPGNPGPQGPGPQGPGPSSGGSGDAEVVPSKRGKFAQCPIPAPGQIRCQSRYCGMDNEYCTALGCYYCASNGKCY